MPMPANRKSEANHKAPLLDDLANHPNRLRDAARLLRDPQLLAALDEFHDNEGTRRQAARDPAGFLTQKGVHLPSGARVTFRPDNWFLGISFNSTHIFGYDSNHGWCFFC